MCNIYITTESENKLKMLFTNIKSFYILDVQNFINSLKLDLNKPSNIYFINTEIINLIKQSAKLKKYQGIIYINRNLNQILLKNIQSKFKNIKEVGKIILLDNILSPKHDNLYNLCEEVYFYERFYKNKIIDCQGIKKQETKEITSIINENK